MVDKSNIMADADLWIDDLPELTTPGATDLIEIIDKSAPGLTTLGTSKKIQYSNLIPADHGNVNASDDLPNNLIVTGEDGTDVKTAGITPEELTSKPDENPLSLNVSAARNWSHITIGDSDGWRDVIATETTFVTGGSGGAVKISLDLGLNWINPTTPPVTTSSIQGFAYDPMNKILIGCTFGGDVFRSLDDGDTWASVNLGALSPTLQDIRFSNGVFIALGGSIIYSPDGSDNSWLESTFPATPGGDGLRDAAFGNGEWILVGGGANTFAYLSTDNGKNWVNLPNEPSIIGAYEAIIFVKNNLYPNGSFFAVRSNGDYLRTQNGTTWTLVNNFGGGDTATIFYSGGQWLIGGGGTSIRTSWDGENFVEFNPTPSGAAIASFAYKQNVFLAATSTLFVDMFRSTLPSSNTGDIYENDGESLLSVIPTVIPSSSSIIDNNSDGLPLSLQVSAARNWTHITVADGDNWRGSIATDNVMLICGDNGIVKISLDLGLNWINPTTPIALADSLVSIAYDTTSKTILICSGNGNVFRSLDDGDTWSTLTLPISANFQEIRFANDTFIVVGGIVIIYSSDGGDNWSTASTPALPAADTFRTLAFGNSIWVCGGGGSDTFIVRSTDNGRTWSFETELSTTNAYEGMTFVKNSYFPNGTFFAIKSSGDYLSSQDGTSWILKNNFGSGNANTIFYAAGQWLIGGNDSSIGTSWDSINFVEFNPSPNDAISSFSYKQNVFIATTRMGTGDIFRSTLPTSNTGDIYENDGESETSVIPSTVAFMDASDDSPLLNSITINTIGVPELVTGRVIVANPLNTLFNVTNPGNVPTITCIKEGTHTYKCQLRCSLDTAGAIDVISMGIFLNGSPILESFVSTGLGGVTVAGHVYTSFTHILMEETDVLTLGVRNDTDLSAIGIGSIQISVTMVK